VATDIMGVSSRLMIAALIDGERDLQVLAELAKGRLRMKRPGLIEALTGRFDEHHGELADLLLDQIDGLSTTPLRPHTWRQWTASTKSPPPTWCPGQSSHREPSSQVPRPAPARSVKATPTSKACSVKTPAQPPGPAPSSGLVTDRRLVRRIGKLRALVAVARSILVITWHLLADPTLRYHDLGPAFFDNRIHPERRKQNHIRQLEALGYTVTLSPAA